jgi:hypothetical protein
MSNQTNDYSHTWVNCYVITKKKMLKEFLGHFYYLDACAIWSITPLLANICPTCGI